MKTAEQIWGAYMQSNQAQNDAWKNLLAEDVSFSGPAMQVKGKEDYIKTTENFFQLAYKMINGKGELVSKDVEFQAELLKEDGFVVDDSKAKFKIKDYKEYLFQ